MQTTQVDHYEPLRLLVQASKALSSTAVDLGATITAESDAGWELWSAGTWSYGDGSGQIRDVDAKELVRIPSRSLSGVWAKSSGTPTLVATGARKSGP